MLRATDFEFRYRVFVNAAIFFLGFGCYLVDPMNLGAALVHAAGHGGRAEGMAGLRWVFAGSGVLVLAGAWLRTWGAAYLQTEVVHDAAVHSEVLVADGPYRHLRNPLYLGTLLMALGLAPMASRLGAAVIVVLSIGFVLRLVGREEAALLESQGEAYRRFRDAVPMLLPAIRPRLPAGGHAPRWGQALLGEMFMWMFAAAVFAYAATLDLKVMWVLLGIGMATLTGTGAIARRLGRRRASPRPGAEEDPRC